MKGDTEVVLMIVFFFSGAGLMALASNVSATPYIEAVLAAAATLSAAFFGAKYAFTLQARSEEQQAVKEQVEAGNGAIFELIRTYNQFLNIQTQFINEQRKSAGRHLFMLPMAGELHVMRLRFDELAFLFDSEDANLLGRLSLYQQEVANTIDVIRQRSQLHVEVVQPTVEQLERQIGEGERFSVDQLEKLLGPRYTETMRKLTDFMITGVDEGITNGEIHIADMHRVLKTKFVGHKIINMQKRKLSEPTPSGNAASPERGS